MTCRSVEGVGTYSGEVSRGVVDPVMIVVVETSQFPHFPVNFPIDSQLKKNILTTHNLNHFTLCVFLLLAKNLKPFARNFVPYELKLIVAICMNVPDDILNGIYNEML